MEEITVDRVAELVSREFPHWAHLAVTPVERQGWDNRTFRLGEELVVRIPSAEGYSAGVEKEDRVLPFLAGRLPVAVPVVVASVRRSPEFPRPWTVRRWMRGATPDSVPDLDHSALAGDLGHTLRALRELPTDGGPWAGVHTAHRGVHPSVYGAEVQRCLDDPGTSGTTAAMRTIWLDGISSAWQGEPVWFHGDVAVGNLLVTDGRLSGLIDFGQCGVGDPACDLAVAWTLFTHAERRILRDAVGLDDDTWRRGRAWALWKALITAADAAHPLHPVHARALPEILEDAVIE